MKVTSIKKQEEILAEIRKVLWQIKTDLFYNNKTIDFEIIDIRPNEEYSFKIQNELVITMDFSNDGSLLLYNEKYKHNVTIFCPPNSSDYTKIRGEWLAIKDYFAKIAKLYAQNLSSDYHLLLGGINKQHLVDYVNQYIAEQKVDYKIDNINNIDWKYIFNNVTIDKQFLDKLYFDMDMKQYCQYGDVIWQLIDEADIFLLEFLFLNKKTSLENKLDYIGNSFCDDVYITDEIIKYRNENGVEVDNLLISYLENNLPINTEVLSQQYPLTNNIITRFMDKLSLDYIMKNETIKNKYDIIVLFKDKINQQ